VNDVVAVAEGGVRVGVCDNDKVSENVLENTVD
jgi:hypothetical protein